MGVLYSLQKELQEDARSVKLSWVGNGVLFDVSTDNGKTWESVENGKITRLKNPGRKIVVKALLPIDPNTFLDNYILEINPAGYSLFTGKVLEESTGLVYFGFGARWYDPEIGRFISVDPAEDGENWYALCDNDPVNYFDPDGRLSLRGWGVLWGGLKVGFKQYALKTVGNVATGIAIGSAIAVCMPAIMPTLPASIPIIVAAASYTMIACDIGPDLVFLVKEFSTVFLSKNPSDAKVRAYGFTISKVGLKFAGLLATSYGMRAIMKTGILQKISIKLGNGINKILADERGSINLGGNNGSVDPLDKPIDPPKNRKQLRKNMIKNEPPPFNDAQAHHRLPWKYADRFAEHGLNANDSKYGQWVDSSHQSWSRAYNNQWERFFSLNANPSRGQILNFLNMLGEWPR